MQTLNIILPVFNEESCLEKSILQLMDFLNKHNINYYLTIADNGSDDNTPLIAASLCKKYNNHIEYLKISAKGVGIAIREAVLHNANRANPYPFIGYMDIDLSTDIHHINEVYYLLCKGNDIVIGSRLLKDSKVYGRSLKREIISRSLNLILRFLLNVKFSDAMCGFKFYSNDVAQLLIAKCPKDNSWFYCATMLIVAQYNNIHIKEIPVQWIDDPNSKVKIIHLAKIYLSQIAKLFIARIKGTL